MELCPFCMREGSDLNTHWKLIEDGFPVAEGHHLIIPKRHVSRLEDLTYDEFASLGDAFAVSIHFMRDYLPDFNHFNIGLNNGKAAGQTIGHVHFHIIPRKDGDVEDPVGGVRGVIPSKKRY